MGNLPSRAGTTPGVEITGMTAAHRQGVLEVYAAGIATGHATFEPQPPSWEEFDAVRLPDHRWVALGPGGTGGEVLGWAAACPVSDRCVYAGVVEHSIYVHPDARGRGLGRQLLTALLASTGAAGIWTVQTGIFPENTVSIALHRACGFRVVGTRERLGLMSYGPLAGVWRDVVLLEHRAS